MMNLVIYFYEGFVPEVYINNIGVQLGENVSLTDGGELTVVDNGGSYDMVAILANKYIISHISLILRVQVKIQGAGSVYPTLTVSFPGSWVSEVTGLCGNFNSDPSDDFQSFNGTLISPSSSLADIYYLFGVTCEKIR